MAIQLDFLPQQQIYSKIYWQLESWSRLHAGNTFYDALNIIFASSLSEPWSTTNAHHSHGDRPTQITTCVLPQSFQGTPRT